MTVIRRVEQETGHGVTALELTKMVGKGATSMINTLSWKGWLEGGRWFLTDEGVDQVDGPAEVSGS